MMFYVLEIVLCICYRCYYLSVEVFDIISSLFKSFDSFPLPCLRSSFIIKHRTLAKVN